MMRRAVGCAVIAVLGWAVTASAAETLESVQKKIADLTGKYKTLQYNVHMASEGMPGEGMPGKMVMDGQFQAMRKGDKTLSRMDAKTRMTTKMGGKDEAGDISSLTIVDGEFIYTVMDQGGQKMATKSKVEAKAGSDPLDSKQAFEALDKDFNLKILPDQSVDGKEAWGIEATPKDTKNPNMPLVKMVTCYDKKTGLPLKSVGYDKEGKAVNTTLISDVKVNSPIPAERFVFKAPPGVEVMDMTKMGGGSMPAMPQDMDDNQPEPAGE